MATILQNLFQRDRDKDRFHIPRSVQQTIPIRRLWKDGVFEVTRGVFSKTYRFTDVNYADASPEDKEAMFQKYCDVINSFEDGAATKTTIITKKLNKAEFEKMILLPYKNDGADEYRKELNDMLLEKASGASGIVWERYLTVSIPKRDIKDARTFFSRVTSTFHAGLARLGSICTELDAVERLRILHDFYNAEDAGEFSFDLACSMRKGHSFKDVICPDSMVLKPDYFQMGARFGRVFFVKDYSTFVSDDTIAKLSCACPNMMLSIDALPKTTEDGIRLAEKKHLGAESNIFNFQRRQNANNNYMSLIPYDLEMQRKETRELLDDLVSRDQRLLMASVTITITADSLEQLEEESETLCSAAQGARCKIAVLRFLQLEALQSTLPIGVSRTRTYRTFITESLAALMPFRVQEVFDAGGFYYGENKTSKNMILCNKANLMNPNSFLLGVPGSGKSFAAKMQLAFLILGTDDDVLICDPENEYSLLVDALCSARGDGVNIRVAAGSQDHINAMDMADEYGDSTDPVIEKSEFVLSLFEQLSHRQIDPHEKSIIDRCIDAVYKDYKDGGELPTLLELRKKLEQQPEEKAKGLALTLELFTTGSLNTFAHETNVDVNARVVNYNIKDLGEQLMSIGALVITDAILNRVAKNWVQNKRTHIFIDEFHVLFSNEHSATFFDSAWRRFRKLDAHPTEITQNVSYVLDAPRARTMLSNSEFLVMLNHAPKDRENLAELLNIADEQLAHITNAAAGDGLIRYGGSIVPFVNNFPKNTKLYKLMSTKPKE